MPQHAFTQAELGRVGDDRLQAVALKQLLEQQKFRVQVLLLGFFVNDSDAAQGPLMTAKQPFIVEHRQDAGLQQIGHDRRWHQILRDQAACALRLCQHGIEHRAARVGVDLDESKAVFGDMKIVAKENPHGAARVVPRDGRRVCQDFRAVCRQRNNRFDGLYDLGHARLVLA